MAINDNTSYELTGAQVKDLANKIKGKADDNTFVGASSSAPGSKGLVPQPQAGDDTKYLKGDGSWATVTSTNIDWSTIAMKGTWTTPATGGTGTYVQTPAIDVSAFGFSSADDYMVTITNRGGASNGWAVGFTVSDKTATSFKVTQWNCHWASGTIGAGNVVDWAVFRVA